jgi:hypothetical protein
MGKLLDSYGVDQCRHAINGMKYVTLVTLVSGTDEL